MLQAGTQARSATERLSVCMACGQPAFLTMRNGLGAGELRLSHGQAEEELAKLSRVGFGARILPACVKETRKNNCAAPDVVRTLVSAAPRLISAFRGRPVKRLDTSVEPAGRSARATSPLQQM
jgi:hypothetical protein